MSGPVGSWEDARDVYLLARFRMTDRDDIVYVNSGEDRDVWRIGEVVYKYGLRATANPYDHAVQTRARELGYAWAPPASALYTISTEGEEVAILAMPYLTSDGSDADEAALTAMHRQSGGQVDSTNYVVCDGQPIVIDCCTVRLVAD